MSSQFDRIRGYVDAPAAAEPPTDGPSRKPTRTSAKQPPRWWGVLCGFVGNHLAEVRPAAAAVWLCMFRFSNDRVVTIGVTQLAELTGMTERYVKELISELTDKRLIQRLSRGQRNKGVSRYKLLSTGTIVHLEQGESRGTTVHHDGVLKVNHSSPRKVNHSSPISRENRRGGSLDATAAANGAITNNEGDTR